MEDNRHDDQERETPAKNPYSAEAEAELDRAHVERMRQTLPPQRLELFEELRRREFSADRDIVAIAKFRENLASYLNRLEESRAHLILIRNGDPVACLVHRERMTTLFENDLRVWRLKNMVKDAVARGETVSSHPEVYQEIANEILRSPT
jgi:hypothetical protein